MTRNRGDKIPWRNLSEKDRADIVVENSLKMIETASRNPDFPDDLRRGLQTFKKSVKVLPRTLFNQYTLDHTRNTQNPLLYQSTEQASLRAISQAHAMTLIKGSSYDVFVNQEFAATYLGVGVIPTLLAEELGHATTKVKLEIGINNINPDSYMLADYEETLKSIWVFMLERTSIPFILLQHWEIPSINRRVRPDNKDWPKLTN
jgi:hypothetical protein